MALTNGPRTPRRAKNQPETKPFPVIPPPAEPTPDRGATLNLRNPDVLRGEWDAEARKSEQVAKQDRETVDRLRAEAGQHEREAGKAADEEMRLMEALDQARQRLEHHANQKDIRLAEAKQVEDRAQFHEDRAADLWESMTALPPSNNTDARPSAESGQGAAGPAGPTKVDLAEDLRLDQGVANLMRIHDEDPAGEPGAA